MKSSFFLVIALIFLFSNCSQLPREEIAAMQVLKRVAGEEVAQKFKLEYVISDQPTDSYSIAVENDQVIIKGSSQVALCRGSYDYLRNYCGSIVSWSGDNIQLPDNLPDCNKTVSSPFKYHYYFNTVTHGYTTPYWGWDRWERELDWMALHGFDMPLIGGAHEAILYRVFKKLGMTDDEVLDYFSGPAHFPWNRMGNIGGWDGPPPVSFFDQQIALTHKMLDRMYELEMHPIVHAFAGFVPEGLKRIYPDEELREVAWGGFEKKVQILGPHSKLFAKIGGSYIKEWEKEFGKGEFYLADSFNEMDVPLSEDPAVAAEELAAFGELVYRPIVEANPDAVWVMQGWTFPYHRDKDGKLFWTPERLKAMMSKIPDDKLLILDMANEYNALFWKIDHSWEMYDGFFGKQWIYSFIPNMGGKVPLNGVLDFYATAPKKALDYEHKRNLVGFGFAPEGIENNEVIYELCADWGWQSEPIDLDDWLEMYSKARYGGFPTAMKTAWELLRESSLGTFTDHPRFRYQFRPWGKHRATVHQSEEYKKAVQSFLACSDALGQSPLYVYDAIELAVQYFGLEVDGHLAAFMDDPDDKKAYDKAIYLMDVIDRLLASHPNHKLENWVDLARNFGNTTEESDYYESNAKRLITTWGGWVNDYSARQWNGLTGDYYKKRWQLYFEDKLDEDAIMEWEENWIMTPWVSKDNRFDDPIEVILTELQE